MMGTVPKWYAPYQGREISGISIYIRGGLSV
ncbi:hypothetical protein QFZ34_003247 [Phyllobacterium ifriqiyense]|uniref:Uncharacterized protein n=1 Tax=Phyllobacterium ifriqiyense TaxID=314238 RepID=A0ABU0SDS0_9HYPH|nr:hypothetical protein [Phyllobacterium ifriqiyense]